MFIENTIENHLHQVILLVLYFLHVIRHVLSADAKRKKEEQCAGEEVAGVLLKKLPALQWKEDPPETKRQRRCLHCKPRCSPLGKAIRRHCCCDGRMRNQPPLNRDIAISRWNKHWIKVTAMIRTFQIVDSIFFPLPDRFGDRWWLPAAPHCR